MPEVILGKELKCLRCDHQWIPRKKDVRRCPSCKSPYWDRAREIDVIQGPQKVVVEPK